MSVFALWILIASGTGPPVVIAKFADESACRDVALQIESKSKSRSEMTTMRAICVRGSVLQ